MTRRVTTVLAAIVLVGTVSWIAWQQGWLHLSSSPAPDAWEPRDPTARALKKARTSWERGDTFGALEVLDSVVFDAANPDTVQATLIRGNILFDLGRVAPAEAAFREVLGVRPTDIALHRRMSFLLAVQGRRWEAAPHLLELVKQGVNSLEELVLLGDVWPDYELPQELNRYLSANPTDPRPLLGRARLLVRRHDAEEALPLLTRVVRADPNLAGAQGWLGLALLEGDHPQQQFERWNARLTATSDQHPLVWYARGLGAARFEDEAAAARCLWESVRLDPNFEPALFQLTRVLTSLGRHDAAAVFRQRAQQQYRFVAGLRQLHLYRDDLSRLPGGGEAVRELAELCEQMGRPWEARGWYAVLARLQGATADVRSARQRLEQLIETASSGGATLATHNPAAKVSLADLPLPNWARAPARSADGPTARPGNSEIRFVDSAGQTEIDFRYFNGASKDAPQVRLLETTGGGIGVIDFNLDGWPDIYFTQGSQYPPQTGQQGAAPIDRLYANTGDGKFRDVTSETLLGDPHYSQGVSVGDVNSDGFPDIYIANLGKNRLLINQGDGTFRELDDPTVQDDRWTTSCLIADLTGDALPDLFAVNYVGGAALTSDCRGIPCPPTQFPGLDDQFVRSDGAGGFFDETDKAGLVGLQGKGLGVLAADFGNTGQLNLFVANDGTPNFFLIPRVSDVWQETGLPSGLALDDFGKAQACMGIAADDMDGDGELDLFVTNFFDEVNTLYLADAPGSVYRDATRKYGLGGNASKRKLGFGTQSLDADLDGWPDLALVNGHVQDFSRRGVPYRMPPQFFRNLDGQRFEELGSDQLGEFFTKATLGRGMARLDWNRDGREDFAVSHLDAPAALLTNQTVGAGNYLAIELKGVTDSRDATGTSVELFCGGRRRVRQLTAGDGYLCSNE